MATDENKVRAFPMRLVPFAVAAFAFGIFALVGPERSVWVGIPSVIVGVLLPAGKMRAAYFQLGSDRLIVLNGWARERIPRADIVGLTHGRGRGRTSLRLIHGEVVPVEVTNFASASRRREIEEILANWIAQGDAGAPDRKSETGAGQSDS